MSLDLTKGDTPIVWRITKLRITECSLVDRPANDMATIESMELAKREKGEGVVNKYSPEFKKYMTSMGFGYIVGEPDLPPFLKAGTYPAAAINAATGTNSASRGPGAQFGPTTPAAMAEVDMVQRFAEELEIAITELGEENENANLTPAAILAQAVKIARQRMLDVTDRSADYGSDPSLNPTSRGVAATAAGQGDGESIVNQMFSPNGFELKKRMDARADDGGLLAKMSRSDRVSVGGLSSALLKNDDNFDMRKIDGSGDADISVIIREPHELAKRLSARSDMRKVQDLSIASRDARVPEFRGSYSPGILGDDFTTTLAKRLKNARPTTLEDLLH